jgi:hypothetical protein
MNTKITGAMLLGLLWLPPLTANAQNIRPECTKMRDKLGCTCALNNGGAIDPNTHRWFSVIARNANNGRATNQAFTNCVANGGRS